MIILSQGENFTDDIGQVFMIDSPLTLTEYFNRIGTDKLDVEKFYNDPVKLLSNKVDMDGVMLEDEDIEKIPAGISLLLIDSLLSISNLLKKKQN